MLIVIKALTYDGKSLSIYQSSLFFCLSVYLSVCLSVDSYLPYESVYFLSACFLLLLTISVCTLIHYRYNLMYKQIKHVHFKHILELLHCLPCNNFLVFPSQLSQYLSWSTCGEVTCWAISENPGGFSTNIIMGSEGSTT